VLKKTSPLQLIGLGFVLLVGSWFVLLLMVIRQIQPDIFLSMAAYAVSIVGLILGFIGAVQYARKGRGS
jgi:positive regulator of sigma E activity